jgi:hypothetical protein
MSDETMTSLLCRTLKENSSARVGILRSQDSALAAPTLCRRPFVRRRCPNKLSAPTGPRRGVRHACPLYCDELPIGSQFPTVRKPDQFARINTQGARNLTQNGYAC